jgi:hypothetical protein
MDGSTGADRWVQVSLHRERVTVESADGRRVSLSYPGILLTGFEDERKVCQRWVPLGAEASETDDERLIEALRTALLWQDRDSPFV